MTDLDQAAREVGATVLGDPPHYLMTAEQLRAFIARMRENSEVRAPIELPPLPY